ncbi:hypothetical protein GMST_36910 [Geomonas silvestris]|uniref:Uncharacterized protein n=1 Tax=Geomonas silvestris TaxID=2740184 RepID=A0A6V8MMW0_9BACT|nr:hypothetical protein GMST_36910 [Geomonas silvestris]
MQGTDRDADEEHCPDTETHAADLHATQRIANRGDQKEEQQRILYERLYHGFTTLLCAAGNGRLKAPAPTGPSQQRAGSRH